MIRINYKKQDKISQDFKFNPQCLNCRQRARRFNCPIYGYFYNPNHMDDSCGHNFVCRECWIKTPQQRREWCQWQIFTQEKAQEVEKDWNETKKEEEK